MSLIDSVRALYQTESKQAATRYVALVRAEAAGKASKGDAADLRRILQMLSKTVDDFAHDVAAARRVLDLQQQIAAFNEPDLQQQCIDAAAAADLTIWRQKIQTIQQQQLAAQRHLQSLQADLGKLEELRSELAKLQDEHAELF